MSTKSKNWGIGSVAIILAITAALSILMQVILDKLQRGSKLVIIAFFTGYELEMIFAAITWISFLGLLTAFCVYTTNKKHKLASNVITAIAVIFIEIPLTLYLLLLLFCSFRLPGDPVRIKSPDGKHCIIRTTGHSQGRFVYMYYIKDKVFLYHRAFEGENDHSDPEFEWNDKGIVYNGELYEC